MTTVIRVHPQTGGYGAYGNAAGMQAQNQVALVQQQLQNERNTSDLKLQYERALWTEKLKETQLQSAIQYGAGTQGGYGAAGYGQAIPISSLFGAGMGSGLVAGRPLAAGVPLGYGGGTTGSGQTNMTNQTSTGAASQTVSNANSYASTMTMPQYGAAFGASPYGGYGAAPYGYGGYQSGGFVSNLLRGLF